MWFTNVIKPTHRCNLRCRYCYNEDERRPIMSRAVLRRTIDETFQYAAKLGRQTDVDFIWHGGEPMLAGLSFYREVLLAEQASARGLRYANSIQTNGTLIDEQWAAFFKQNDFDVSLSLDGPGPVNDLTRCRRDGAGSFERVMAGIAHLRAAGVPHGVCVVLCRSNMDRTDEIFEFLARERLCFNVIPLTRSGRAREGFDDLGIGPDEYARPWIRLFDRWFDAPSDRYVQCTDFIRKARAILIGRPTDCIGQEQCAMHHISTDPEGYVYPCATLSSDRGMSYGTVASAPLAELMRSARAREATHRKVEAPCTACKWRHVCHGGCMARAAKFFGSYDIRDYYCPSLRLIYEHIERRLREHAEFDCSAMPASGTVNAAPASRSRLFPDRP